VKDSNLPWSRHSPSYQLNERIATTQCARQSRQKWDICDFRIPKLDLLRISQCNQSEVTLTLTTVAPSHERTAFRQE